MRCNCGIDPKNLSDEHLLAESIELKMIPSLYKRLGTKNINKVPTKFTLGEGHMLFFLYKSEYTLNRYKLVLEECRRRGINVKDESSRWDIYNGLSTPYTETGCERHILIERIVQRITESTKHWFHYNHERITKEKAIRILINDD